MASNTKRSIEETCDLLLHNRSFTYEGMVCDPDKAFRSPFILQLLANTHLRTCAGSVDVPTLQLSVKEYQARSAIALCLSAVSHRYHYIL